MGLEAVVVAFGRFEIVGPSVAVGSDASLLSTPVLILSTFLFLPCFTDGDERLASEGEVLASTEEEPVSTTSRLKV